MHHGAFVHLSGFRVKTTQEASLVQCVVKVQVRQEVLAGNTNRVFDALSHTKHCIVVCNRNAAFTLQGNPAGMCLCMFVIYQHSFLLDDVTFCCSTSWTRFSFSIGRACVVFV